MVIIDALTLSSGERLLQDLRAILSDSRIGKSRLVHSSAVHSQADAIVGHAKLISAFNKDAMILGATQVFVLFAGHHQKHGSHEVNCVIFSKRLKSGDQLYGTFIQHHSVTN